MDYKQIKNILKAYEETIINENLKKKSKYFNLISDKKYYLNMLNLPKGRYIFEKNCKDYFLTTKIKNCSNKKNNLNNNNFNLYKFKNFPIDLFEDNNMFEYFNLKENNKENFKFLEIFEKKINIINNNNNNQNKNKKHKNKNNNIFNLRKFNLMQIDNINLFINTNLLLQKINLKLFFNYFTLIKNNNFNNNNNEKNNIILTKNSNLLLPSFINIKNFDFSTFYKKNNKFELNENEKNKIIKFKNYVKNNHFNILINNYFILFEGIIIKKLLFNNFLSKIFFNNFLNFNLFINNNNNLFNDNIKILENKNKSNFNLKNYINFPPFFFKEENINEIFLNLYNKNLNNNKNKKSKLKIIFPLETTTKIFPRILPSFKLIKNLNNENYNFNNDFYSNNQSYLLNINNNNNNNNELKNYLNLPKISFSKIKNKIKKQTFNEINNIEIQNKLKNINLNDNNNKNNNNKNIILVNDKIEIKFYNKKYIFLYYPINNNLIDFIFSINSCGIILTTEELNDSLNIDIYNNIYNTISKNYLFFDIFYIFILNKKNKNEIINNNNKEKLENYLKEKFNIEWLNIIIINIITFVEIYDILDNLFSEQNINYFDYINLNDIKIKNDSVNKMINIYENFLINNIENEEILNEIKNIIINKYKNKNISLNL